MSQEIKDSLTVIGSGFIGGMGKWITDIQSATATARLSEALLTAVLVTAASWLVKEGLGALKGMYKQKQARKKSHH